MTIFGNTRFHQYLVRKPLKNAFRIYINHFEKIKKK